MTEENKPINKKPKFYLFRVGPMIYRGLIISENETHWTIDDIKEGIVDVPKTAVRKEIRGEM